MNRVRLAFALACLVSGAALPLAAQNLGDLDGDGVPNVQDRCPNTPRGVRVDANGCPATGTPATPGVRPPTVTGGAPAQQPGAPPAAPAVGPAGAPSGKQARTSPTLVRAPAANPATPAVGPQAAPGPVPALGAQPTAALVTPQAVVAPAAAAPVASGIYTAGLAMPPFAETAPAQRLEYGRTLAHNLDSAIVALRAVFQNTTGQPMPGASAPTSLSPRERDRWSRCRDLHFDLASYVGAVEGFLDGLEGNPALERSASALDSTLSAMDATVECDNVSSMIAAPDRWDSWAQQYSTSARRFYTNFYTQIRDVHEKDRAFVMALNAALPAGRALPVPPGLPRNPPYAGATVR